MTNSNTDKKTASKSSPVSHKPDAELKENELEQISGSGPPIAVFGHSKKPFKVTSP